MEIVTARLDYYLDVYELKPSDIKDVQVSFRQKDKKLLSEFSRDKPFHVSINDNIIIERELIVPVSINKDSLETPLPVNISNGIITNVYILFSVTQLIF